LLSRCLWNGSTPLHRKTPSDRDVLLNLYHSTAHTSACWERRHRTATTGLDSRTVGAILKTVTVVPGRRWEGGWADASAGFVIHGDIVESPQRLHHEL